MCFPSAGTTSCPGVEKNRIKSIVTNLEVNLASENWGFQFLTSLHKQNKNQALAQNVKRVLFLANGVLLKAQRGAFWKSVQPKLWKVMFFGHRRHFLENVVFQCLYFVGQRQINRGAKDCKWRIMSFIRAGMTFWSVKVLEHHDLRKMKAR